MLKNSKAKIRMLVAILIPIFIIVYYVLHLNVFTKLTSILEVVCEIATMSIYFSILVFFIHSYYKEQINKDKLTELFNRGKLDLDMNRKINKKESFWLAYIDIDKFKSINDTLGHGVGNSVLKEFSLRLKEIAGTTAYRIGGDEFVLIIEDCQDIEERLYKIVKLEDWISLGHYKEQICFSMGVVKYPRDGTCKEKLLEIADSAMYISKKEKLPYYIFGEEI